MSTELNQVIEERLDHIHTVIVPAARKKNQAERAMVRRLDEDSIQKFRESVNDYRAAMVQYHSLTDRMHSLMQDEDDAPACRL